MVMTLLMKPSLLRKLLTRNFLRKRKPRVENYSMTKRLRAENYSMRRNSNTNNNSSSPRISRTWNIKTG